MKDADGRMIVEEAQLAEHCKKYFDSLLNCPTPSNPIEESLSSYSNQIEVLDPTYDEVVENIGRLKNHKSTGSDNIPAELIKYGGSLLYRELHKLILKIWQQEKIPDEWKKSVIIPIHKSGDKEHIENYRGISVVNTAYKVLSSLLLARLKPLAEDILGDYQCGFRGNRSTTDNIFAVKMINEKMWEFNRSVQYLFVDFSKAYDSIHRQSLWNIMKDFQIPAKLIRMCQVCMDENVSQVLINNQYSDPFSNRTGLRQGDGLSPLLFNLALEMVARKMRMAPAGIHLGDRHKIFAYADDIVLAGENEQELRRLLVELVEAAARVGLTINQKKTKYLVLQRGQIRESQQFLRIGQYSFERVQCFKFLGVHIDDQNQRQTEMQIRLNNANKAYHSLRSLLSSRLLSRNSKLTLYNTIIKPVLLYGSETWSVTKREEHQMQVFENKVYRTIFGPYFDHQTQWTISAHGEANICLPKLGLYSRSRCPVKPTIDFPGLRELFLQYLDMDFWEVVSEKTNIYHCQNSSKHETLHCTPEEILKFVAVEILMGCLRLPQARLYWCREINIGIVSEIMPRNRYYEIRNNIHFVNNLADQTSNKLWKVQPLITAVRNKCLTLPRSSHLAIDEQMIPFAGKCDMRTFMPSKPNPLGLKNLVMASPDGLILDFHVYTGKGFLPDDVMKTMGLGAGIVTKLCETVDQKNTCVVYTDRYFTSLKCAEVLLEKNIYLTGTVRSDRTGEAVKKLKSDKQMKRGDTSEVVDDKDKVAVLKWKDNKSVLVMSTNVGSQPATSCTRWSQEQKRRIEVTQPCAIKMYNKNMGGIDLHDRLIAYYRSYIRTRKWPVRVFNHFVDLVIVNCWLTYRRDINARDVPRNERLSLLEYRFRVAKLLAFSATSTPVTRSSGGIIDSNTEDEDETERVTEKEKKKSLYLCITNNCFLSYHQRE
ncbi:hypothetical protein M8J76_008557 [Diaphorina citri]|nr:hypothetical protein M8J76_008557 [Diaphorina citri]